MEDEQALLLDAPLRAESPQLLYPQVRTEADGRSIIAVSFEVKNVTELTKIRNRLLSIKDVMAARRGQN